MMEQFKMIVHDVQMFNKPLDKILMPGDTRLFKQHVVVFSDLDIIGHVNNVKYMEWCIDAATSAENSGQEIHEFEINFNHEAMLGDLINIYGYESGDGEVFFLATRERDGKEIISASLKRKLV